MISVYLEKLSCIQCASEHCSECGLKNYVLRLVHFIFNIEIKSRCSASPTVNSNFSCCFDNKSILKPIRYRHFFHFRHRYNLEELRGMLVQLKRRADSFDNWASEVRQSLEATADAKVCKYQK